MAAEELKKAILNNLDYEKLWRKRIGLDLLINLKIRKMLNNFKDEDYNKLIKFAARSLIVDKYNGFSSLGVISALHNR